MPYTKSLIKLNELTDMKIAKNMSETDTLRNKIMELENLRAELHQELESSKALLIHLVNEKVVNISAYYKTRSNISLQGTRITMIEMRIDNINEDLNDLSIKIAELHEQLIQFKRKKKNIIGFW